MNKLITLLTILLISFASQAQSGAKPVFDKQVHEFGAVDEGPTYKTVFIVTNEGDEDLKFINAGSSCGCTVAQYPKKVIKPGESDTVVITYNSHNRFGKFYKEVTLWDSKGKEYKLAIKGYVKPERALIEYDSNNIYLAALPAGQVKTITLQYENRGAEDLKVTSAKAGCGNVSVKTSSKPLPFGEKGEITIVIDTRGREEGAFECAISVESNSYVYSQIYVRGNIVTAGAQLELEKEEFNLGILNQKAVETVQVKYTNTGSEPLTISEIVSPCSNITAEGQGITILPGGEGIITITVKTKRLSDVDCVLTINSNALEPKKIIIKGSVAPDK